MFDLRFCRRLRCCGSIPLAPQQRQLLLVAALIATTYMQAAFGYYYGYDCTFRLFNASGVEVKEIMIDLFEPFYPTVYIPGASRITTIVPEWVDSQNRSYYEGITWVSPTGTSSLRFVAYSWTDAEFQSLFSGTNNVNCEYPDASIVKKYQMDHEDPGRPRYTALLDPALMNPIRINCTPVYFHFMAAYMDNGAGRGYWLVTPQSVLFRKNSSNHICPNSGSNWGYVRFGASCCHSPPPPPEPPRPSPPPPTPSPPVPPVKPAASPPPPRPPPPNPPSPLPPPPSQPPPLPPSPALPQTPSTPPTSPLKFPPSPLPKPMPSQPPYPYPPFPYPALMTSADKDDTDNKSILPVAIGAAAGGSLLLLLLTMLAVFLLLRQGKHPSVAPTAASVKVSGEPPQTLTEVRAAMELQEAVFSSSTVDTTGVVLEGMTLASAQLETPLTATSKPSGDVEASVTGTLVSATETNKGCQLP
ncbi:hypothetical protein PLESTM_001377000 [Pleodorina starrii]|nr:hypothetical protein PLESTM_001377000 [Pleodorina starrii]